MEEIKNKVDKNFRQLEMYDRLRRGEELVKKELANKYGVSLKTIQRDIEAIRSYLSEKKNEIGQFEIKARNNKYKYIAVDESDNILTERDILALSKILLESRAFNKREMTILLKKLQGQVSRESQVNIRGLINNEDFYYVELQHGKYLIDVLWDLSTAIRKSRLISFDYTRMDKKQTKKEVKPAAIMFSEFYFYLIGYSTNSEADIPLVFRIDRMSNINYTEKTFYIPYTKQFEDGEFRKRIQFMYGGKLKKFTFEFSGPSLEAMLDRLPTAKVIKSDGNIYTITAESYGDGIRMWLNSQGDNVKILEEREV